MQVLIYLDKKQPDKNSTRKTNELLKDERMLVGLVEALEGSSTGSVCIFLRKSPKKESIVVRTWGCGTAAMKEKHEISPSLFSALSPIEQKP